MICRRCGRSHEEAACPLCGQPRPEAIATKAQREAYRQRLFVTLSLPLQLEGEHAAFLSKANHSRREEDRILATFQEENLGAFLKLWDKVAHDPDCELLFNGRRRPYDRELWIPLIWIAASGVEESS